MHAYKSLDFFFVYNSLDAWNVYPENAINFDWLQLHLVSIYSVDDDNSDRIFSENSDAQCAEKRLNCSRFGNFCTNFFEIRLNDYCAINLCIKRKKHKKNHRKSQWTIVIIIMQCIRLLNWWIKPFGCIEN